MGRVVSTTERDIIRYYIISCNRRREVLRFYAANRRHTTLRVSVEGANVCAWGEGEIVWFPDGRIGGGGRRRRVSDARGDLRSHRAIVVVVVVVVIGAAAAVVVIVVVVVQQTQTA